jgi:regulator of sirC expression with transglutaminase-like and TPR domain
VTSLRDRFATVVAAGDRCDLAQGALTIARIAYPDLDSAPYLRTLDDLAAAVRPRLPARRAPEQTITAMTSYFFEHCGFRGNADDYYDPRNSFLNDVLERRTGIPISLAVLLIETGARVGVPVEGVGFPGHFLVRVGGSTGPILLDPFFGGRVIGRDEMLERLRAFYAAGGGPAGANLQRVLPQVLQATGPHGILGRMLANLLRIYLDRNDHVHALATVDLMLVLAPDAAEQIRIRGLLYEQLDCVGAALADLRRYLTLVPADAPHVAEVREHTARLARVAVTVH